MHVLLSRFLLFLLIAAPTARGISSAAYDYSPNNVCELDMLVYELLESIKEGSSDILSECACDPYQAEDVWNFMLKNFSLAEIALESLLRYPLVVVFYDSQDANVDRLDELVDQMGVMFADTLKFVKIETNALFKVALQAGVRSMPTFLFILDRCEIRRIEICPNALSLCDVLEGCRELEARVKQQMIEANIGCVASSTF